MKLLRIAIPLVLLTFLGLGYFFFQQSSETIQDPDIEVIVARGPFTVAVNATGELQAKRSEKIRGPQSMRSVGIYNATISNMVPEGTVVQPGAFVASLDRTELDTKIKEVQTEIEKIETQLEQTKIDTAIEMREIRDKLVNLKFAKEEKRLQVAQNKFEPESVIRQSQLDLEKTEREYEQLKNKYELTREKSIAKVAEDMANLKQNQIRLQRMLEVGREFRITAPKDGMVIYARSWNGKISSGSQISTFNPVVAELPDLTDMVSKTYVNEVDISKVMKGQEAVIKVDAFPDASYTGQVIQVANIGEQLRGYDSKVFEVIVQLNGTDSILRPAMTTGIEIVTEVYEEVVHLPLEAIHNDSVTFVYHKSPEGIIKQEVITGSSNLDDIIIAAGVNADDVVYLSVPDPSKDYPFNYIDPAQRKAILADMQKARMVREAEARKRMEAVKNERIQRDEGGDSGVIIF